MRSRTLLLTIVCIVLGYNCITADIFEECANVLEPHFVAYANNCQAYIYCDGEDSYMDECPSETYFVAEREECDFDDELYCYNLKRQQEAAPLSIETALAAAPETELTTELPVMATTIGTSSTAAATAAVTKIPIAAARPSCQRTINENFPHPLRCEYFYRCISGYLTIARCGRNAAWDYLQQKCAPAQQAQCYKPTRD